MFNKQIKVFEFSFDTQFRIDTSGGLRYNPRSGAVEVPQINQSGPTIQDAAYVLDTGLFAATWIAHPRAVKKWSGFQATVWPPRVIAQDAPEPLYGARYRLGDGGAPLYHDGAAWTVATLTEHWNSEAEVAANIETFPVQARKIQVFVNMWTNDSRVTPRIRAIKVLYDLDIDEIYDLIYGSLVVDLKESVVGRARVAYNVPADSDTLDLSDLSSLGFDSSYNIVRVDAAYNHSVDENHLRNIYQSFDGGLLTLSEVIPENGLLWVEFGYRPTVAVQTDSDYIEVSTVPRIDITNVEESQILVHWPPSEEYVINKLTGQGWAVPGPRQANVNVTLEITADKQYEMSALKQAVVSWVTENPFITMRGVDEEFEIQLLSGPTFSSNSSRTNLATTSLTLEIRDVNFYDRQATPAYSIKSINFTGGNVELTALPPQ